MAFGLTLCLLVVFVKGCVGNNNTTSWNSGISSTTLYGLARTPSVTLVRPSTPSIIVNTSTLILSTTTSLVGSSTLILSTATSLLRSSVISSEGSSLVSSVRLSSLIQTSVSTANGTRNFVNGSFLTPSSSAQFRVPSKNTSFGSSSVWANSSFGLNASSRTLIINHQKSSTVQLSSSTVVPPQGRNKIFNVEILIQNMNFSSEHQNLSSSVFKNTSSIITTSIDSAMKNDKNYKICKVVKISPSSGIVTLEVTMGPGSSSDPKTSLANLQTAVQSSRVGSLTVDPNHFTIWPKGYTEEPQKRERLLPGQLAGVALILFILVVLLLIICLGNFADEPVFNERELFTEEISMENVGSIKDTREQQEDEEWKFDPLFAWSPRKSFDSKL